MKIDLFTFITHTFNSILINNPLLKDEINLYKGSIIFVDLKNTKTQIYMKILESGIEMSENFINPPDLTIRATPLELANYFFLVNRDSVPGAGNIEISGNIGLAQTLQSIFAKSDVDWEDKLSELLGDEFSHSIFYVFNKFVENAKYGQKELANNFSEYVKFEKNIVISESELNIFNQSVDQLRDDVDKLNFRINRLIRSTGAG